MDSDDEDDNSQVDWGASSIDISGAFDHVPIPPQDGDPLSYITTEVLTPIHKSYGFEDCPIHEEQLIEMMERQQAIQDQRDLEDQHLQQEEDERYILEEEDQHRAIEEYLTELNEHKDHDSTEDKLIDEDGSWEIETNAIQYLHSSRYHQEK